MTSSPIAEYIRSHKQELIDAWERSVVAGQEQLARLERGALIDHLPEVLDGLAAWIEGRTDEAERAFGALADGHALQRLGFGIELSVLNSEYARLRSVVLWGVLSIPASPEVREQLIRFDEGLDRAIQLSVRRYTEHREFLRDRFIGILGHDLRNPLSAASAAAEVLLRLDLGDEQAHRPLQTIARSLARMDRMIGDVLDFARGHLAGGIPVTPVACDMGEICRAAAEEAAGAHPERTIRVTTHGDLGGTFDRDRVLQAIGNLLGNAIQHGRDPIVVDASETADHRALVTRVTSRGRPIPEALVRRLFEPFVQSSARTSGGVGLGLYIVAQIVRGHGGTCDVTSSEGETTFTLRWPRTPLSEAPDRT